MILWLLLDDLHLELAMFTIPSPVRSFCLTTLPHSDVIPWELDRLQHQVTICTEQGHVE